MGQCCSGPRTNRKRSASDPNNKSKDAPKFSPVSKDENDENGNKSDEFNENDGAKEENDTLQQTTAHIGLTKNLKRRMSGSFEAKLITINIENKKSGEIKQLPIMNSLTVSQMKSLIAKHCKVIEPRQKLKYNDMMLDSSQLLSIYNIQNNDTIFLYVLEDSDILELNIDYKSGTIKKQIFVTSNSKLIDFRKEVNGKIPTVSLDEQQFFYGDIELDDDEKLLKDYNIPSEATIRFEWKSVY
mmetsp:Transcript_33185/g.29077  ORF Transcript_33185/g.29077 Transcript_33185/m.29077 type:complete len:242 (-) Transcript_33185:111-836(-)